MQNAKKFVLLLSPFIFLTVFIMTTDPYKLPLPLLLLPFLLLEAGSYIFIKETLKLTPVTRKKRVFIAASSTSIILLGVLLQSIRQLSVKDFIIMAVLLIGTTFYLRRIDI